MGMSDEAAADAAARESAPSAAAAPAPRFLTAREVAADLRVSLATVYNMLAAGEIPRIRVRAQWRVPRDRYERWRAGEEDPAAQRPQVLPLRRRTAAMRGG